MTITFPRPLIDNLHISQAWIDLLDNVAMSPSGNGNFLNLTQVNDPTWKGTFVTGTLDVPTQAIWSAWKKSLRGGINQFTAFDVRKKTPGAYPNAKVPGDVSSGWSGTVTVTSLGASGALGLSALPTAPAYQFKAGDRVGLEQSGFNGYYEILEDVLSSGGVATVTVAPFLHTTLFDTSAVCRLWRPICKFIIDQTSWSEQGTVENTPISFNGNQRL